MLVAAAKAIASFDKKSISVQHIIPAPMDKRSIEEASAEGRISCQGCHITWNSRS